MKRCTHVLRFLVVPLVALATVATLVTGAQADRGGKRHKDERHGSSYGYRAPGGYQVRGGYAGSYRAPGGFTVRRQLIAPRQYGSYGYARGPRVVARYRSYPSYPAYGTYMIRRPVSGGYLCGPVGGGLSFSLTLGNVLPAGACYYDPYCHEEFASLSTYYAHCHGRHAAQVRVMQRDGGYYGGNGYDRGYDDGAYDDRGDDGYYDDGGSYDDRGDRGDCDRDDCDDDGYGGGRKH